MGLETADDPGSNPGNAVLDRRDRQQHPHKHRPDLLSPGRTTIFGKTDVSSDDASEGADVLVTVDLRDVETHGVSNMLRMYVALYNASSVVPDKTGFGFLAIVNSCV